MAKTGFPCIAACVALGTVLAGCSTPAPPPAAAPLVSYDGHYEGAVRVSGVAAGGVPSECTTDPRFSVQVSNNAFVYAQPHPKAAGTSPDLTAQATTVVYNATISPEGSIAGSSDNLNGTISGTVSGTHMNGQINGLLCYYTFTAVRS